jgi:hypothetical protein
VLRIDKDVPDHVLEKICQEVIKQTEQEKVSNCITK